ncbi:glycosyl transferase family 1 [Vibrio albus]|uniref:Glycosyl transferase family 1 n=1 Tax=Vibrio albus TaxID=2200953 RepID=A0A2U3B6J3_9VIBR|nr:glycosyltransferase family 4 protein [Vibrio albus]PWI32411.1 glycosyl transferase family 1 [Vibrio albus]
MNILLMHFRVGETDGVSLEMDKWKWALNALGHKVFYLAGSAGCVLSGEAELVPELHYQDPLNNTILHNAYVKRTDYSSEAELMQAIDARAEIIANQIIRLIEKSSIDMIVPNNVWSLGYHLPAASGLMKAVEATQTPVICHHHDFFWERDKYSHPTGEGITTLLNTLFPPKHPLITHCVINRIAQRELKQRRNIDATVVPNVFDFQGSHWHLDDYNRDLRERFGIREHDVLFLQATRIVSRKGIELAIDLIHRISQQKDRLIGSPLYNGQIVTPSSRLILMFAGQCEEPDYLDRLVQKADKLDVELLFINDRVAHSRTTKYGQKVYSLWDVYCHADIITYPSLLEGWGNQFLEGLVAKVPMVVYRYPVYDQDIADYQFNIIDLGNQHNIDEYGLATITPERLNKAADDTVNFLTDIKMRKQMVEENYAIGETSFSYQALKENLHTIFPD